MGAEYSYDTTNLRALRLELELLNDAAAMSGLIAPPKAKSAAADRARNEREDEFTDQGKAAARRMLTLLGRIEGDVSPSIFGTKFTEEGVVRLLADLRKRSVRAQRGNRYFRRILAYLTRPVAMGTRTSAGIGVHRLQRVSRRLHEIEAHGWQHFQLMRAARRGKRGAPLSRKDRLAASPATPGSAQ